MYMAAYDWRLSFQINEWCWLLERHSSPEFEGPWQNQISTALWFTSSSLFFTQREQIHNNYALVVVSVWLFVLLTLSSSYTASLSSMLTAPRLEPNVTDMEGTGLEDSTLERNCRTTIL